MVNTLPGATQARRGCDEGSLLRAFAALGQAAAEPEAGPRLEAGVAEAAEVGARTGEAAAPARVLVSTEASCRGLDLPQLDMVLLCYSPLTSDTYVHLAGRTGRGAAEPIPGTVLSLLAPADGKRMGLFSSQLGIAVRTRHPALQAAFEAAALEVL